MNAHLNICNNITYITGRPSSGPETKQSSERKRRTERTIAVRWDRANGCVCEPIEALLQPRVPDECAGVIRVGLWDNRRVGTRGVAAPRGTILPAAAVV